MFHPLLVVLKSEGDTFFKRSTKKPRRKAHSKSSCSGLLQNPRFEVKYLPIFQDEPGCQSFFG